MTLESSTKLIFILTSGECFINYIADCWCDIFVPLYFICGRLKTSETIDNNDWDADMLTRFGSLLANISVFSGTVGSMLTFR